MVVVAVEPEDVDLLTVVGVVVVVELVVVTTGGASVWPAALGGGFVGAMSELPKIFTSICWAAG